MMRKRFGFSAAFAVIASVAVSGAAYGDVLPYSIDGTNASLVPSADSLSLSAVGAGTLTLTAGVNSVLLQTGSFIGGDSGSLTGSYSNTFFENLTIDGVTKNLGLTFTDDVTVFEDQLHLTPVAADFSTPHGLVHVAIGDYASPPSITTLPQSVDASIHATVTYAPTPEPFTMALLAGGAVLAVRRRRTARA